MDDGATLNGEPVLVHGCDCHGGPVSVVVLPLRAGHNVYRDWTGVDRDIESSVAHEMLLPYIPREKPEHDRFTYTLEREGWPTITDTRLLSRKVPFGDLLPHITFAIEYAVDMAEREREASLT